MSKVELSSSSIDVSSSMYSSLASTSGEFYMNIFSTHLLSGRTSSTVVPGVLFLIEYRIIMKNKSSE